MGSAQIKKVGYDLNNDFNNLQRDFDFKLKNVADLKNEFKFEKGLSRLVSEQLGIKICK